VFQQQLSRSASVQVSISEEHLPENQRTINLVLRMRNTKRELNDIRFEFQPTKVSWGEMQVNLLSNYDIMFFLLQKYLNILFEKFLTAVLEDTQI
jgi:hypothetical protein